MLICLQWSNSAKFNRVYTVCHSICIFWTHYCYVKTIVYKFQDNDSNIFGWFASGTFSLRRERILFKYHKNPKRLAVIILKLEQCGFTRVMHPKYKSRMANRVDPDQTALWVAVWSGSTSFALNCPSENLGSLRYLESLCKYVKEQSSHLECVFLRQSNEPHQANLCLRAFRHDKF